MFYHNPPQNDVLPDNYRLYIGRIREGRSKARQAAIAEALSLLADFQPVTLSGGPLGGEKGVFWFGISQSDESRAEAQFRFLGYTCHVRKVYRADEIDSADHDDYEPLRWKGQHWLIQTIYVEDEADLRERAPDRRIFMLRGADGTVRPVQGYRGDGTVLGRRGLAPEDARLLVNLAAPASPKLQTLLDPFAGIGGLVIEARSRGLSVYSGDIDPVLQAGLQHFGAHHSVLSAGNLPFRADSFDAIATELPFHEDAAPVTERFMGACWHVLKPGGRVAAMVVDWQVAVLEQAAQRCGFRHLFTTAILRKGTDVFVGVWEKTR